MQDWKQKLLAGLLLAGLTVGPKAWAQAPVVTQPGAANSGDASGTLAATNVFQLVWAGQGPSNGGNFQRRGCLVLNNSATNRQWVYFQGPGMTTPTAGNAATIKAASIPLEAAPAANGQGGYVSCATGAGQTLQDAVWIAGTIGDSYVAKQQ